MEIKRMWEGGPLREFSETAPDKGWRSYQSPALTGYTRSYVCEQCQSPCDGVYFVRAAQKWLCGACKKSLRDGWKRLDSIGTPKH